MPKQPTDYISNYNPTWCPGCGNFGLWGALKKAFAELDIPHHKLVGVYGIGCSGNGFNFTKINAFHGLHGRPLPVAEGVKLANHELKVVVLAGDGDGYGEGGNHFLHALRANHNIAYFVHNNQVYSLTTGQNSPTTEQGRQTKSNPLGTIDRPINPLALALAAGGTFVARGFTGDIEQLAELMKAAMNHRGFGYLDILQPCITYNKHNTYQYFRERVYTLGDHDTSDYEKAWKLASQWEREDKIPLGILYQDESVPAYHEQLSQLHSGPAAQQDIHTDIASLMVKYT